MYFHLLRSAINSNQLRKMETPTGNKIKKYKKRNNGMPQAARTLFPKNQPKIGINHPKIS
jgi:ribosomal protein L34E